MNSVYVTEKGARTLQDKKNALFEKLKEVQGKKGEAAEVGGNAWHDNASFEDLCRQEQMLNKQIEEISKVISSMIIVRGNPGDNERLSIGHIATLYIEEDDEEVDYLIGGYGDTDLKKCPPVVAYNAPIIVPFYRKEIGRESKVLIDGKMKTLSLEDINLPEEV